MKKIFAAATSALMFLFVGSGAALAQDAEGPTFVPVEAYACNFNDGKGISDLRGVVQEWNAWMDANEATNYTAIVLRPQFFAERAFDIGWLGVWPNGEAMGAGMDAYRYEGQEMAGKFGEVLDCGSHTQFATAQIREPAESDPDDNTFVLSFSNCSLEDGKTMEELDAAQKEWNAYADEHGIVGGAWMMFPVWGEAADSDYDFKAVGSTSDYSQLGANWHKYASGHYQKNNEIFEDLLDCDSARIYSARTVRRAAESED